MNSPLRVCVVGAGGRVGSELLGLIKQSKSMVASFGVGHRAQGFEKNLESISLVASESIDIVVDFSSPELFEKTIQYCIDHKIPLVSGTTGLSEVHHQKIKEAASVIPVLWAPNMSLGIAVLKNALKVFKATKDFDFQIEEWHHRHKKDRPSGTALFLQKELEAVIGRACPPPMVMRGGGIFGVHKVYAASDEEIIQFEHTAINRTVFARGALVAASWLISKSKGLYTMDDVIS
jgi:4-hydroxy-tetrahydrodipicolinate reductase